ncbi:MAG TPA: SRPBCC domain-containing protein [Terriglobales bacterium]|nr:SRPBCC domain-containing protein [Terriglobales bacterium]
MSERQSELANAVEEFVISRTFEAPRDLVFKAWTEKDRLSKWWGPKGFKLGVSKLELRPGGTFHYSMTTPTGQTMWGRFIYKEIAAPERLVFVNSFSDEKGGLTRHPMSGTWPLEVWNTVTFTEENGRTIVTIKGHPINASEVELKTFEEGRNSMQQGFGGTFEQLIAYLASEDTSDREIHLTRIFDAPRELVFKAWTNPEHLSQWWGPNGFTTTTYEMDFRPGGVWRFMMHGPDGTDYPNRITYEEIVEPERIVYSHGGDDTPVDHKVSAIFTDLGDKTSLSFRMVFNSKEERDHIAKTYGAVEGGNQTLARLAGYVASQKGSQG